MDLKSDVAENTAAIGEVKTSTVDNKAIADGAAEKVSTLTALGLHTCEYFPNYGKGDDECSGHYQSCSRCLTLKSAETNISLTAQAVVDLQSDVMDNTAAIAVLNATSSNKPGQSECNAGA